MANSGTVTAGSAALASQYNNLRDDVLNVSTGHTHTGASENGKKVEGSAIASTGATNGQVLAADGAGGASFTTVASAGAFSYISGTAAFSTATNAGGSAVAYQASPNANQHWGVTTSSGSVIVAVDRPTANLTAGHWVGVYGLAGTAYSTANTITNSVAGTAWMIPGANGFATATAPGFVLREQSKTGTTLSVTLRKFTTTLTNSWNTLLFQGAIASGGLADGGPFELENAAALSNAQPQWAPGPGIWYGGDLRDVSVFSNAGTTQIASVWIVNDSSGVAYSAPFGSATTGAGAYVSTIVFVPSSTAATDGTIHAWGANNTTARYVTYAVGSASISAVATADYPTTISYGNLKDGYNFPVVGRSQFALWLESESKVMITNRHGIVFADRTITNTLQSSLRSGVSGNTVLVSGAVGSPYNGAFDPTTGFTFDNNGRLRVIASYDGMALPFGTALKIPTSYDNYMQLAGSGSATFIFGMSGGGTPYRWDLAGYAKITLDAGSTANRLITLTGVSGFERTMVIGIGGGGSGVPLSGDGALLAGGISFIASGTQPVVAYVAPGYDANLWNQLTIAAVPPQSLTSGGTAVITATKITLA